MNSIRIGRVNAEILRCLSNIIFEEAHDSILKNITITACETTNDLSLCKVYFTSLDNTDILKLEKELNDSTAKYLRGKLAEVIDLRSIPELRFKYDNSIEYGNNIEKIIEGIHKEN